MDRQVEVKKRFFWILGLSWIFIVIPLCFLFPRILQQAKQETVARNLWRAEKVKERVDEEVAELFRAAAKHMAIDKSSDEALQYLNGKGVIAIFTRSAAPDVALEVYTLSGAPDGTKAELEKNSRDPSPRDVLELGGINYHLLRKGRGGLLIAEEFLLHDLLELAFRQSAISFYAKMETYSGTTELGAFKPFHNWGWNLLQAGYRRLDLPRRENGEYVLLDSAVGGISFRLVSAEIPFGSPEALVFIDSSILILALCFAAVAIYRLFSSQIEINEQQQNFISAVSHELKTPLASIRMYSEMLRREWLSGEAKRKEYYDFIFYESERLARLISNVLGFAQLSRRKDIHLSLYDSSELLELLASKIRPQVAAHGFELVCEAQDGKATAKIFAEEDAMVQVFLNLTDNALKFSQHAAEKKIMLGLRHEAHSKIVLTLRDFGPGIEKKQAERVFDLFYRAENELTRKTPGIGLGLALVKELSQRMNATIKLSNREPGLECEVIFDKAA